MHITASFQKQGNDILLLLPQEILDAAHFSVGETVELIADETGIRICKTGQVETLSELFKNYDNSYRCRDIDTGDPVGHEVW